LNLTNKKLKLPLLFIKGGFLLPLATVMIASQIMSLPCKRYELDLVKRYEFCYAKRYDMIALK
jgi:hypothetical protein